MNFHEGFVVYLKSKRPDLAYREDYYEDPFTYGRFPDDLFDQTLSDFYYSLAHRILPSVNIDKNDLSFNPNEGIDEAIAEEIEQIYKKYDEEKEYFKLEVFPEAFKENIKKWILVHLEEEFLKYFHKNKGKFSDESLEKILEGGMKDILINGYYGIQFGGTVEDTIEYINRVMIWFEKISFHFLYSITNEFFPYYLRVKKIDAFWDYKNILYWLKPDAYFPDPKIDNKENHEIIEIMIENLLKLEKSVEIPKNIFSEDLKANIKIFIEDLYEDLHEGFYQIPDSLRINILDIQYRLYLHFLYFGLIDGKIPSIKQGAISIEEIEDDLKKFLELKNG